MTTDTEIIRSGETVTAFHMRRIRNEVLREAAAAAEMNLPNNEPGEYARGRLGARDDILALIDA